MGTVAANILCAARDSKQVAGGGHLSDYAAFEKAYKARSKREMADPLPDAAAQAALAVYVFADALRRAGSRDNEKVRDALAVTDIMTFFGRLRFTKAGNAVAEPMIWRQIQDGKYNIVAPAGRATHNFQWPRSGL